MNMDVDSSALDLSADDEADLRMLCSEWMIVQVSDFKRG